MRLRLLRHALADYARLKGTPQMVDAPLSPSGEAQLPAPVERLTREPPGFVYCSPTLRTMATASAVASGLGVRLVAWSLLCEQAFLHGALGLGRSELRARFPLIAVPDEIPEQGWTAGKVREDDIPWSRRARQVLHRLLERHPHEATDDVLFVTHLGFAGELLRAILGLEENYRFTMGDTAITAIQLKPAEVFVEYVNCMRHLNRDIGGAPRVDRTPGSP